jgi:hypothetical protein
LPDIDPEKDYPFTEAARLIPSPLTRSGHIHLSTLHGWRKQGFVQATQRQVGGRKCWFLPGRELLRLLELRIQRRSLEGGDRDEARPTV